MDSPAPASPSPPPWEALGGGSRCPELMPRGAGLITAGAGGSVSHWRIGRGRRGIAWTPALKVVVRAESGLFPVFLGAASPENGKTTPVSPGGSRRPWRDGDAACARGAGSGRWTRSARYRAQERFEADEVRKSSAGDGAYVTHEDVAAAFGVPCLSLSEGARSADAALSWAPHPAPRRVQRQRPPLPASASTQASARPRRPLGGGVRFT